MIGICQQCGNYDWDKDVFEGKIYCPKCGNVWEFKFMPMFILTGCSGVGKTTTAREILQRNVNFVVLDADIFYGMMPLKNENDYQKEIENIENLSKNIMQSGQPVLWAMAGNLDKVNQTYNRRFFSHIFCLALVCDEKLLQKRMTDGRGITDNNWITSSIHYNHYLKTHDYVGDMKYEVFDISGKSVSEVADYVIKWVNSYLN